MASSVLDVDIHNFDLHEVDLKSRKGGKITSPQYLHYDTSPRSGVKFSSSTEITQINISIVKLIHELNKNEMSIFSIGHSTPELTINRLYSIYFGSNSDVTREEKMNLLSELRRIVESPSYELRNVETASSHDIIQFYNRHFKTHEVAYRHDMKDELLQLRESTPIADPKLVTALDVVQQLDDTRDLMWIPKRPPYTYVNADQLHKTVNKFSQRTLDDVKGLLRHAEKNKRYVKRVDQYQNVYRRVYGERASYLDYIDLDTVGCDYIWRIDAYYDDIYMGQVHVFYRKGSVTQQGKSFIFMQGIIKDPIAHFFVELYPALRGYLPTLNDLLIPAVRNIARAPEINVDYILVRPIGMQAIYLKRYYGAQNLDPDDAIIPCGVDYGGDIIPMVCLEV